MTKLSAQVLLVDRWDRVDLQDAVSSVRPFARRRKAFADSGPGRREAFDDAFWALHKAAPVLLPVAEVEPAHWGHHRVISELLARSSLRRLRAMTVGDSTQAALACVELADTLEGIFDRLEVEEFDVDGLREVVDRLNDRVAELEAEVDEQVGDDPSVEELAAVAELLDVLERTRLALAKATEAAEMVERMLLAHIEDRVGAAVFELDNAARAVARGMDDTLAAAQAWGVSRGEWQRLSAGERIELARKLNHPRMREVAALFGRMQQVAWSLRGGESEHRHEEMYDLEFGDDLGRVVPSELMALAEPAAEDGFFARMADRALVQYAMRAEEPQGRGGIVYCLDGSGSMAGWRELWGKALMLYLLHEARRQRRSMHVIHFGSTGMVSHHGFTGPEDFSAERIIEAAEVFEGAGTDFETPLQLALELLQGEHDADGGTKADVVFATDGLAWLSPSFLEGYHAEMARMGARTWAVYIGSGTVPEGVLWELSSGRVMAISDLQSGRGAEAVLRGVRAD